MSMRASVLLTDVTAQNGEPLIRALEAIGLVVEQVLSDPDDDAGFFLHASDPRTHDEESLAARKLEVAATATSHGANVADWSIKSDAG